MSALRSKLVSLAMIPQAMKAMKTSKSMKKRAASKIARGTRAKSSVLSGRKEKTSGGLRKGDLTRNKNGRVVSKKMSARGKKAWAGSKLKAWTDAVKKARKALGVRGFVGVGGKTAEGKALYAKAKSLL